jgi:hypothetical protein
MAPKFTVGQKVRNRFTGHVATITAIDIQTDVTVYDVEYQGTGHKLSGIESAFVKASKPTMAKGHVLDALTTLAALREVASDLHAVGVLSSYDCYEILYYVDSAEKQLQERASNPGRRYR